MQKRDTYVTEIDGLRAFSVLAVLLFHGFPSIGVGGFIGVDIFFVISGFVISRTYLDRLISKETTLRYFYLRRIRRLAPAYILVLLITTVFAFFVLEPELLLNYGESLIAQPFYAQNFVFWFQGEYFHKAITKPLLHTWSLAVEEQFYLLFGIMIITLRKRRDLLIPLLILAFFASLTLGAFFVELSPKTSFYLLPTRVWEFALGICAFLVTKKMQKENAGSTVRLVFWLCLAGLVTSVFAFDESNHFPGVQAILACSSAAVLLVVFEMYPSNRYRHFRGGFSQYFGQRSYSLYLWHWPVIMLTTSLLGERLAWYQAIAALGISILLSDLTYRYVENPVRKGIKLPSSQKLIQNFAISSVVVAVLGIIAVESKGWLQRYDEPVRTLLEAAQNKSPYRCPRMGRILSPKSEFCLARQSDKSFEGNPGLLILGDSHADVVDELIARMGNDHEIPVYMAVRNCSLSTYGTRAPRAHCNAEVRDEVFRQIEARNIQSIIAISFWKEHIVYSDFERNVEQLSKLGIKIFLSETVPHGEYFDPTVRAELLMRNADSQIPLYNTETYMEENSVHSGLFIEIEKKMEGRIVVLRPRDFLCNGSAGCDFSTDGYPNYFDNHHLSAVGMERLRPMYKKMFRSLTSAK